jgi:hypothetical protein
MFLAVPQYDPGCRQVEPFAGVRSATAKFVMALSLRVPQTMN